MSEQVLKAAPSGLSLVAGSAESGSYPVLKSDRNGVGAGKMLPVVEAKLMDMERLARELNLAERNNRNKLQFQIDLDGGHAILQVIDHETGEIIRQIPQEKATVALSQNGSMQVRLLDDLV